MLPRAPSLFYIEEGEVAAPMPASGQAVGLRLIIQSPRQRPAAAVVTKSAVRFPATNRSKELENGKRFVGLEFLKRCFCCHKKLDGNMDVFVYKGEQAFCSPDCRCQEMAKDARREIEILVRRRRDAHHSRRAIPTKIIGANQHKRVQTAV